MNKNLTEAIEMANKQEKSSLLISLVNACIDITEGLNTNQQADFYRWVAGILSKGGCTNE